MRQSKLNKMIKEVTVKPGTSIPKESTVTTVVKKIKDAVTNLIGNNSTEFPLGRFSNLRVKTSKQKRQKALPNYGTKK